MAAEPDEAPDLSVPDNPAARLQIWLLEGDRRANIAARDAKAHQNRGGRDQPFRMKEVWSIIWDIDSSPPDGFVEYTRRAAGMIEAGAQVRQLASASDNFMAPEAIEHFHEVESALADFMEGPRHDITAMMGKIKGTGWHSLKLLDKLLSNEFPQPTLSHDQSHSLLAKARALIDALGADETLPEQARLDLIDKVREVEAAIIRAQITGTPVVVAAADGLIGFLARIGLRGVDVMNHPLTQLAFNLAGAIWVVTQGAAAVSEIAAGPFGEPLRDLLSLPSPPEASGGD